MSLAVGGVSFGQRPFALQLTVLPPLLEQPIASPSATTAPAAALNLPSPRPLTAPSVPCFAARGSDRPD
jgi:hypothetical protein